MPFINTKNRDRIRELNDAFRKSFDLKPGKMVLTDGVNALPDDVKAMAFRKTVTFEGFSPFEDHSYDAHEFGTFKLAGRHFCFTISYFDSNLEFGSEDPADPPEKTKRVLTLMLVQEYDAMPGKDEYLCAPQFGHGEGHERLFS